MADGGDIVLAVLALGALGVSVIALRGSESTSGRGLNLPNKPMTVDSTKAVSVSEIAGGTVDKIQAAGARVADPSAGTTTSIRTGETLSTRDTVTLDVGEETAALPQGFSSGGNSKVSSDDFDDDDNGTSADISEIADTKNVQTSGGDTINKFGGISVL